MTVEAMKNKYGEVVTKLVKYGFPDFQIEELMKKKKLETGHGVYSFDSSRSRLYLKNMNGKKEVVL